MMIQVTFMCDVNKGANAEGVPKRLTFEEIQSKTYMEVKGTGTANQCPTIEGGLDSFAIKPGKYYAKKLCLEPTSFTVKSEGVSKNSAPDFQNTKLMTRLTYTLDEIEGPFEVILAAKTFNTLDFMIYTKPELSLVLVFTR